MQSRGDRPVFPTVLAQRLGNLLDQLNIEVSDPSTLIGVDSWEYKGTKGLD